MATATVKKKDEPKKFSLGDINTSLIIREDINTGSLPLWTYCRENVGKKSNEYIVEYQDADSSYTIYPNSGMPGPIDHHFFRTVEMMATEIYLKNKFVPETIFLGSPRSFLIKAGISTPGTDDYKNFNKFLERTQGLVIKANKRWKYFNLEQAKDMGKNKKDQKATNTKEPAGTKEIADTANTEGKTEATVDIPTWKWAEESTNIMLYGSVKRVGSINKKGEKTVEGIYITFGKEYHANLNSKQITKVHFYDVYKMIKGNSPRRLFEIITMFDKYVKINFKYSDLCRLMQIKQYDNLKRAKQKIEEISDELFAKGILIKSNSDWFVSDGQGDWVLSFFLASGVTPKLRDYTNVHDRIIADLAAPQQDELDSVNAQRRNGNCLFEAMVDGNAIARKNELKSKYGKKAAKLKMVESENEYLHKRVAFLESKVNAQTVDESSLLRVRDDDVPF